jgi:hypothetical protein
MVTEAGGVLGCAIEGGAVIECCTVDEEVGEADCCTVETPETAGRSRTARGPSLGVFILKMCDDGDSDSCNACRCNVRPMMMEKQAQLRVGWF